MNVTQPIAQKLNDSASARWTALIIVSFTMMMGYYVTDLLSPLEKILTAPTTQGGLGWSADNYGFFSGSYGLINVFLLMLFFGGIILDKLGIRFTGVLSTALMVVGVLIKYVAVSTDFHGAVFSLGSFSLPMSAAVACLGFAIFGVGCEITGITISKTITKWFTGHELALAMGVQVALARLGTAAALSANLPMAKATSLGIQLPVIVGAALLIAGFLGFLVYNVMDRRLDASIAAVDGESVTEAAEDESFKFSDLGKIFSNPGFWLIALLCLLFYSGVFPFLKFATKLMISNYNVPEDYAGMIPGLLPFGTIILTPLFGIVYDKVGKGATLMLIGSVMLTAVHFTFMLNVLPFGWFAIILMLVLGVAFALIFYIQNIGLTLVPMWIGKMNGADPSYRTSMAIFTCFGAISVLLALALLYMDKKKGYGLQKKNSK